MHGVINVLKPPGMTSHDVVARIRRIYSIKKVGHAGTLDPEAAGVLPVCLGQATRLVEYLTGSNKEYYCRLTLGIKTTTQDAWGDVLEKSPCESLDINDIKRVVNSFSGKITQITPIYSAVKQNGVPLYKKARAGEKIEPRKREVFINKIDIVDYHHPEIAIVVGCSKGTYIRTLCNDIGEALKVGGHMSFLIRTRVGIFHIDDSKTIEEINVLKEKALLPMETCITGLKRITLDETKIKKLHYGQLVEYEDLDNEENSISVLDEKERLHAIVKLIKKDNKHYLKSEKVFNMEYDNENNNISR